MKRCLSLFLTHYDFCRDDTLLYTDSTGLCTGGLNMTYADFGVNTNPLNWLAVAYGATPVTSADDLVNTAINDVKLCKKVHSGRRCPCCCIKHLTIIGHGLAGMISIGAGTGGPTPLPPHTTVDITSINLLMPLKPYFCENATLSFNSCFTGQGPVGREFIDAVSKALGVTVTAGTGYFDDGGFNSEGDTVHSP